VRRLRCIRVSRMGCPQPTRTRSMLICSRSSSKAKQWQRKRGPAFPPLGRPDLLSCPRHKFFEGSTLRRVHDPHLHPDGRAFQSLLSSPTRSGPEHIREYQAALFTRWRLGVSYYLTRKHDLRVPFVRGPLAVLIRRPRRRIDVLPFQPQVLTRSHASRQRPQATDYNFTGVRGHSEQRT